MARCSPFGHAPHFRVIAVARARFDRVCAPFLGPFLQGSLGPSATYVFAILISVRVGPAVGRQDEKDVPWTRGGVLEHVRGGPDGARLPPLLIPMQRTKTGAGGGREAATPDSLRPGQPATRASSRAGGRPLLVRGCPTGASGFARTEATCWKR